MAYSPERVGLSAIVPQVAFAIAHWQSCPL
jgi:hypothetical protein